MLEKLFVLLMVLIFSVTTLLGCTATPHTPDLSSDHIKAFKSVRVYASNHRAVRTGVHVDKGEFYTLFVTGQVKKKRSKGVPDWWMYKTPEEGLGVTINEQYQVVPPINATLESTDEGEISLIAKSFKFTPEFSLGSPGFYDTGGEQGSFNTTIIVWNTKNIDVIIDVLKRIEGLNTDTETLERLIAQTISFKDSLAETEGFSAPITDKNSEISDTITISSPPPEPKMSDNQQAEIAAPAPPAQLGDPAAVIGEQKARKDSKDQYSPLMLLLSPRQGQITTTETIQLIGVVEDDTALLKVELTVNGTPITLKTWRGISLDTAELEARYEFNERIPIAVGQNQIQIRAEDTSGRISEKVVSVQRVEPEGTVWAVVVGINDYPNLPQLKYAVNDAHAFHDFLLESELVKPDNVFRVINDQATLDSMRTILGTNLKKKAKKGDRVIIYFAGHGATESDVNSPDGDGLEKYLLPFNADPDNLYATALPMREIAHILNRIQSDSLIFIADSCYSGASGGRTVSVGGIRSTLSDNFIDRIASGKGRVILTASAANEVSMEDELLEHGVFTYYLIKGLKGMADFDSDGYVTVDEAYQYVSEEVPKATGQTQHPIKKGSVEGQLVLGIVK